MSTLQDERGLNQAAYRRLKKELEKTHQGKFVGIAKLTFPEILRISGNVSKLIGFSDENALL